MARDKFDVVIIGSGLAGIVAADRLADHDINILMLDENIYLGGQFLRRIPDNLGKDSAREGGGARGTGLALIERLRRKHVKILNKAVVLGVYPRNEVLLSEDDQQLHVVRAPALLFATGARERFIPFKGWTLPGVVSTGAVQVLIKSSGVLYADTILIGGSGPFLLAVAAECARHGGKVQAVLEQGGLSRNFGLLPHAVSQFSKLAEGASFLARLCSARVPLKHRTRIMEARGETSLEEVMVAKVDGQGRTIVGSEQVYTTNALAIGYGFVPNVELPQHAGCELEYDPDKGGWVVRVDDDLATTAEHIYAAGEITGIAGSLKSINEGRIAANTILYHLGKIDRARYLSDVGRLRVERRRHLAFGRCFNAMHASVRENAEAIPDDTVVCRCENVRLGDIKKAIADGATTPGAVKKATRVVMGNCQGRTCGPIVYDLLTAYTGAHPVAPNLFSVRPPIKPVPLGLLSQHYEEERARAGGK